MHTLLLVVLIAIGNNEEQKRKSQWETQDFNVKNHLQQREIKTTDASQQNFTTSGVFTNTVNYLMMQLTLVGGLQGIYI
jgi:hypothetical protein